MSPTHETARTLIAVTGKDAPHLLHSVLTANVETLQPGIARACALLSPQGKVLFDFLIMRTEAGFLIDIQSVLADGFMQRMKLYKLRADLDISVCEESLESIFEETDSGGAHIDSGSGSGLNCVDSRFKDRRVIRSYGTNGSCTVSENFNRWRIAHGIAESGPDYAVGDAFAHDIGLDNQGGLDLHKGCYVGQEVVSRMHHRGTARKRPVVVEGRDLATGATLMAGGRPAGTIGTSTGDMALCIARLDRVLGARDLDEGLTVDGAPVTVRLPDGAIYGWPIVADDAGDGDA